MIQYYKDVKRICVVVEIVKTFESTTTNINKITENENNKQLFKQNQKP
jgi:hypothetical protein